MEGLHLVSDLALILISAGITTIIFKWLKQPLVLGYIVAGFLVGPHFDFLPNVIETASIKEWSEIGIIFLLFALGLEFSFKRLLQVGSTAFITAGVEIISIFLIGFLTGYMLGWTNIESIFLGGMLSMSSTTIVIKAFNDMGIRKQKFADIVLIVLIIQDLVAILMLVLLPTIAVSNSVGGKEMLMTILKLAFFVILWFLIGIFFFPSFFKHAKKLMNDETLLIISIGLCFGMVSLATSLGFSSALGAFVMGSILGETVEGHNIERLMKVIKDLFGAIFFVSVGMMVDPQILTDYWLPIVILSLVTIFAKSIMSALGVLLSGESMKVAVQTGMSLSQIGEFAFIIASMGYYSLGVMKSYIYPVIVAVSVITTFTTPYCIRLADPISNWIDSHMPAKWKNLMLRYQNRSHTVNQQSEWKRLLKTYFKNILIYSVILVAITLLSFKFLRPFTWKHLGENFSPFFLGCINALITLLIMSPFLRGLLIQTRKSADIYNRLWNDNKFNRSGLITMVLFKVFLVLFFVIIVIFRNFMYSKWILLPIALAIVLLITFSEKILYSYVKIERRFNKNLNQKANLEAEENPFEHSYNVKFANNEIHLEGIRVSADSEYVGKQIAETDFRKKYGINIVKIRRGNHVITLPSAEEYIYPYDKLLVIGNDEQISSFMKDIQFEENDQVKLKAKEKNVGFFSFVIESNSRFLNRKISDSNFRKLGFMIFSIERDGKMNMNPSADTEFKTGDVVWVAGEKKNLHLLISNDK